MQRSLERRVGAGELAQQREQIALPHVHLGELRAVPRGLEQRHQLVDDALLPLAEPERLAQPLLAQQDVHLRRVALGVDREPHEPGSRALERGERLGELRQRTGAFGRLHTIAHRLLPQLGAAEVVREPSEMVVQPILIDRLDRRADATVQLATPMLEQSVVRHLLREHVLEAVRRLRHDVRLLDEARHLERLERVG